MVKIVIKNSLMWLLPLTIYILEIVLVCIKGPTLVNNICAWISCIGLLLLIAIPSIISVSKSEKRLKDQERELDKIIAEILRREENTEEN